MCVVLFSIFFFFPLHILAIGGGVNRVHHRPPLVSPFLDVVGQVEVMNTDLRARIAELEVRAANTEMLREQITGLERRIERADAAAGMPADWEKVGWWWWWWLEVVGIFVVSLLMPV